MIWSLISSASHVSGKLLISCWLCLPGGLLILGDIIVVKYSTLSDMRTTFSCFTLKKNQPPTPQKKTCKGLLRLFPLSFPTQMYSILMHVASSKVFPSRVILKESDDVTKPLTQIVAAWGKASQKMIEDLVLTWHLWNKSHDYLTAI